VAFQDPRTIIAEILRNNQTLQKLYEEFGVDFEQTQSELIKDVLLSDDDLIQANTVYTLAENPNSNSDIALINENISTVYGLYPGSIGSPHEDHYRNYPSSRRTSYIYFLKWLYYTYKYYNEEQFFFNNMLNRFVPDYDGQVISSTTHLKVYFDGLGILLDTLDQKIEDMYTLGNVDIVDEAYLQYLAQLLGYQKEDFSIQNISFRELIKNLVGIYQTKGTEYSFELFFKLLGFDAEVREYYWDRDAQNPEQFGSIANTDFLWYLTTQDPRLRTKEQLNNPAQAQPIQPINTADWVLPKDLRDFQVLQSDYSIEEILGYKNSDLDLEDRFTYFKTNFIQFRLIQFYTKQDLTAKDTETILKYVKFLTPIYISSFVEVATTPYQDFFELENPEASSIVFGGDPGIPAWVDILLPFIFITIKDYIPFSLSPASEEAVVIANYSWSDDDSSGTSDDALPIIFGDPAISIELEGTVFLTSSKDLSTEKYIGIKIDKGRGNKIAIQGNTIQTYDQLLTKLNSSFIVNGITATAIQVGFAPNFDIRIYSDAFGTTSKIFLASGLQNDLFSNLSATLPAPIDGIQSQKGYQDFGISYALGIDLTGLSASLTYNFYINVDIVDFIEVDCSGPIPNLTDATDIVNAVNNHYEEDIISSFVTSTTPEYLSSNSTTSGKILIGYRDTSTSNGRLVYMNSSGTVYRSGINFTLYDCRNIAIACSENESVDRNFVAFYDIINDFAKWTVFDNEGVKIIIAQELEASASGVGEIVATTLSNNKIAVAYTTTSPVGAVIKTFDLTGPTEVDSLIWTTGGITNIAIEALGDNLVVGGSTGTGGIIVYLEEDLTPSIGGTLAASTKTFTTHQSIADVNFIETVNTEILIAFRSILDDIGGSDETGYLTVYDDTGSLVTSQTQFTNDDLDLVTSSKTSNGNIFILYSKQSNGIAYFQIFSLTGTIYKKEQKFYSSTAFTEISLSLDDTGSIVANISISNRGYFTVWYHLGDISSISLNSRLVIQSQEAGDTWDDTVDNYADTSDQGHLFEIDGDTYEFDNFAEYHRGFGIDFTDERNKFNTFFSSSPNDDLIPLIQDVLTFVFTLLVGSNEFPSENVEKAGFYIKRNGYISRNRNFEVQGNIEKGYYTRHLDFSEDIRQDTYNRVKREVDWPQWNRENIANDDWSSWAMAIDYFQPSIEWPFVVMRGGMVFGGTYEGGQYFDFTAPVPIGGAIFAGTGYPYGPFSEYVAPISFGSIYTAGTGPYEAFYIWLVPEPTGKIQTSGIASTLFAFDYFYTMFGGMILSAADITADELGYIPLATGGAVLGGSAIYALGNVYIASGGATLSGVVTADELSYVYNGGGFMTLLGVTDTEYAIEYTPIGGMTLSGAALFEIEVITEMSGGIVTGGTIDFEFSIERTMEGGIVLSGTAETGIEFEFNGSGAMTLNGVTDITVEYVRDMSGGVIIQGSGAYQEAGL